MIPLDSPRWQELEHAYGGAADIPRLLAQLSAFPREEGPGCEPFHSLWSALCHQGDVFSASYAAVPHIVRCVATDPQRASMSYYALPTAIEIARVERRGPSIPSDLAEEYSTALQSLSRLAEGQLDQKVSDLRSRYLRAATAIGCGDAALASSILDPDE